MKKRIGLFYFLFGLFLFASAQNLPIKELMAPSSDKPVIFYITGDGGYSKFSNDLCASLNSKGYNVIALNAKSYFWNKKTPEETTRDISNFLTRKIAGRENQQIILIGYSFGADVLPFILNRFRNAIRSKVITTFLIAASGDTNFEIYLSDLLWQGPKRNMDVLTEINKLDQDKIVTINSSDDHGLKQKMITIKRSISVTLPGGHHFDGNTEEIVKNILQLISF